MNNARDDIAFIRQLMHESQAAVLASGSHFLLWGSIAAAGLLATWAAVTGMAPLHPVWVWGVLLAVGWTGSFVIGFREAATERAHTTGTRLLSAIWIGCGLSLTVIAAAGLFGGAVPAQALSGLVSVVIASGFLTTAVLTGHVWMRWVAAAWWAGGALMLFRPGIYTLPLLAVMTLALQVLPGVVLYRTARRQVRTDSA